MFDFAQRLRLALADRARRSGFLLAAGLVLAIAAGFLLAALWSWLATGLGWGSAGASLAIGGGLIAIALILFLSGRPRHPMPTSKDLKREVEAQVNLAATAAIVRARGEASRVMGKASDKVQSFMGQAGSRVSKFASDTEQQMQDIARDAAHGVGLSDDQIERAGRKAREMSKKAGQASRSNPGSMAKLIAAFAIGVAIATRLRDKGPDPDPDDYPDYPEDDY